MFVVASLISQKTRIPPRFIGVPFFPPKSSGNSGYHYLFPTFNILALLDHLDRPCNYTPTTLDLDDNARSSIARSERTNIDDTG